MWERKYDGCQFGNARSVGCATVSLDNWCIIPTTILRTWRGCTSHRQPSQMWQSRLTEESRPYQWLHRGILEWFWLMGQLYRLV